MAPGFVRVAFLLRGLIGPLVDRDSRRRAPTVDRATAELVAERGAFDAAASAPGRRAPQAFATTDPGTPHDRVAPAFQADTVAYVLAR